MDSKEVSCENYLSSMLPLTSADGIMTGISAEARNDQTVTLFAAFKSSACSQSSVADFSIVVCCCRLNIIDAKLSGGHNGNR
jgi:hypothetical protein